MFYGFLNTLPTVAYVFMYAGNTRICRKDKGCLQIPPLILTLWKQDVKIKDKLDVQKTTWTSSERFLYV